MGIGIPDPDKLFYLCPSILPEGPGQSDPAEEGLRHFILTGKPLYKGLTMQQIIALRFASDEEFAGLAKRAADEGLSGNEIKKAIRGWKADHSRV
jgi:hypothetical protein